MEIEETTDGYEVFLSETECTGVLDTACTKTCCGEGWLACYLDTLTELERELVEYGSSDRRYKFGSGDPVAAIKSVTFPCVIAGVNVKIEANVVPSRVPLLLSKEAMKKARMVIDLGKDMATAFGKKVELGETSSGHYCIYLNKAVERLKKMNKPGAREDEITLFCRVPLSEQNETQIKVSAEKLHKQFGHATSVKLKKLVIAAGEGSEKLLKSIDTVVENCDTCKRFKRPPPRPVVAIPIGEKFLDCVAMDLKHWKGNTWILHLIDTFSRYSSGHVIHNKKPDTIIKGIFECWIKFLGVPRKFLSDNGGEFRNEEFNDMADNLNIHVMTTPAEAPWCNGMVEKHNHIIGVMLEKLWEDGHRDLKQNLAWCLNAKNSMENNNGFTPYQLAIGTNPILPNNFNSKLPALEGVTNSEVVANQLQLMHKCRKAFTLAESSERLRRALRCNIRTYTDKEVNPGDRVYYKRNDSDRWRGPAKVIGVDGKNRILKHGGLTYAVHLCRVVIVSDAEKLIDENKSVESESNKEETNRERVVSFSNETNYSDGTVQQCNNNNIEDNPVAPPNSMASEEIIVSEEVQIPETVMSETSVPSDDANNGMLDGSTLPLNESKVKYKIKDDSEWTVADVISRAGKATGKYRNWVNVQNENGDFSIDWEKVESWTPVEEETYIADCLEVDGAKAKEIDRWVTNDVFQEIPDNGQDAIDTRWVVTEKFLENGESGVKARLVAKGFQDPDKANIRSDSPTALKTSLRLATTYISSRGWKVKSFDITAAFLQGEEIDRKVVIRPPPEANCTGLWLLRKAVYGLGDAPRKFYLKVRKELLKMGLQQSSTDPALFIHRIGGETCGVVVAHVDDFYYGGVDSFCTALMKNIKSIFSLSSESCGSFRYVGFDVVQNNENITFNQTSYLECVKPIMINRQRESMKDEPLTREEQREIRGRCGQLNWLSTHTRPDLAFDLAELSGRTSSLKVSDISKMNKLISKVKANEAFITFPCLKDINNLRVAAYADASLGNLPDGSSQGGYVVFLVDCDGKAALIDWKSHKIRRVVRSTLAAETLAMSDAVDAAMLVVSTWEELTGKSNGMEVEAITDCNSLFDNVNSTKLCTEKRLRIDIAMLKQMQERKEIILRWTESENQLADVLTKKGVSPLNLSRVITSGQL